MLLVRHYIIKLRSMIFKNVALTIVIRLIIFAVTTVLFVYSFESEIWYYISTFIAVILAVEIYDIVYFFNGINRKLSYFFDAVRNEDTTLVFPENIGSKSLKRLHKSMNNLNRLISDIKMENESSERFLYELINHSKTGLMSVDSYGYIQNINTAAKNYLGVDNEINIHILQQVNPKLFEVLSSVKPNERKSVKMITDSDVKHLVVQTSVLKFKDIEYRLFSIQDIKKEIDENELDSYQKLIRVMTHEIMNSIAPITSLSNTLSRFFINNGVAKTPDELSELVVTNTIDGLAIIEEQGKALKHFVENYRKMTKIPQPKYSTIVVKDWLNSFALLYKGEMEEYNIKFRVAVDNLFIDMITDDKLLNQVVINIIKNAMSAVENCDIKEISMLLEIDKEGNKIIRVIDSGCGIAPDLMDKIFIPFFTTKDNGDGIGLSLSRQIIKKLKGTFTVRSKRGVGTEVIITL